MESQSLYQDVPPASPVEKSTVVEDFVDVFYAPSKVFDRRREGQFGLALLLLTVLVAALFFATRAAMEPVYDATMDQQIAAAMRKNPNMPPAALESMRSMGGVMLGVGMVVGAPLTILGTALVLFFIARLFDLRPTFGQAAMIATFANVPRWIGSSLATGVQAFFLTSPEEPRTVYQLSLSPARFLGAEADPMILAALSRVELFTLWATVLLGIGIATVCRVELKRGLIAAFLTWGVAGLIQVAMSSAGG